MAVGRGTVMDRETVGSTVEVDNLEGYHLAVGSNCIEGHLSIPLQVADRSVRRFAIVGIVSLDR